jgi:hypothetical protein
VSESTGALPSLVGRALPIAGYSKFRRLAITHAMMMAADASMVVALADSLFFSIEPGAARDKVLLFLVVSFAPFLLIAPLIGPALDRVAGGRRTVIQVVAASRIVLTAIMAFVIDDYALFPLVFVSLVLQKTYAVSKSALVPSVVRTERDLVEANSKLGLIAGIVGFIAVVPAALIQRLAGGTPTLLYASVGFVLALVAASFLSADIVARTDATTAERVQLNSPSVTAGSLGMVLLRGSVGFVLFLIAFVLAEEDAATALYGAALAFAAGGTMLGNFLGPRLRNHVREEWMLLGALGLSGLAGLAAAIVGGNASLVALAFAVNLGGAIGRLGFEAMLQRDAPQANRGRAFATFETRFQLSWAVAGLIPVVIPIGGRLGALLVGLVCAGGVAYSVLRPRLAGPPPEESAVTRLRRRVRLRRPQAG